MAGEAIVHEGDEKMKKTFTVLQNDLSGIRTGRASPGIVEHIKVDYYGQMMPLKQLANIGIPDSKTIEIRPWDKNAIQPIEKAFATSDLKLAPQRQGEVIRLNIPPLTQDRRLDLVKVAKKTAEEGRVSIRNVRQETNNRIKSAKELTEDDRKKLNAQVQKLTDQYIARIDETLAKKETEITTV